MKRITYYTILGVTSDASDDEIVVAFRRQVKQWHPDVCNHPDAEDRMREINQAAEVLCDPERRKRYDRALAGNAPFEAETPTYPRPGDNNDRTGWFPEVAAWVLSPIRSRIRSDTFRFAATGFAALLILASLIIIGVTVLPLFSGSLPASHGTVTGTASGTTAVSPSVTAAAGEQTVGMLPADAGYYGGMPAGASSGASGNDGRSERDRWYNRGMTLLALGMYAEAAESFDRALSVAPGDSLALAEKGAALIGLGRYEESLGYTDRALDRTPNIAWIWNNRGIALENLGQMDEARAAYENAGIISENSGSELYRQAVLSSPGSLRQAL